MGTSAGPAALAPFAAQALDLLANTPRRERMKQDLAAVIAGLGPSSAAQGAARLALQLACCPT